MTETRGLTVINQLLGRISYFHALFIEPALTLTSDTASGVLCCNHDATSARQRPAVDLVSGSAWAVLDDVAATLPTYYRPCPQDSGECCAVCRIRAASAAIASGWADTEYRAYESAVAVPGRVSACGQAAARRIGQAFAADQSAGCRALMLRPPSSPGTVSLPSADELPLTGELLALWDSPAGEGNQPVVSWLNHCTSLEDIRRVLRTRRTGP